MVGAARRRRALRHEDPREGRAHARGGSRDGRKCRPRGRRARRDRGRRHRLCRHGDEFHHGAGLERGAHRRNRGAHRLSLHFGLDRAPRCAGASRRRPVRARHALSGGDPRAGAAVLRRARVRGHRRRDPRYPADGGCPAGRRRPSSRPGGRARLRGCGCGGAARHRPAQLRFARSPRGDDRAPGAELQPDDPLVGAAHPRQRRGARIPRRAVPGLRQAEPSGRTRPGAIRFPGRPLT